MESSEVLKLLADLSGPDEKAAHTALERLRNSSYRALKSYLYRRCGAKYASEFDDIIQETFIKVWNKRHSFTNQGYAAWHRYLQTVATRCFLNWVVSISTSRTPIDIDDIPERELETVIDFLKAVDQEGRLENIYHTANILWLGLDGTVSSVLHRRQILAAKYFYLDGVPWDEVLDLLGPLAMDGIPLTRSRLDAWLEHEGVVRSMAYDELFYSNDRLTWHLLGMAEPVQSETLDALVRQAGAEQTPEHEEGAGLMPEIVLILWRYRLGLHPNQILRRKECIHSAEQLAAVFENLMLRFPFMKQMTNLLSSLEPVFGSRVVEILQAAGLWKRLAFQYCYGEELSHSDIHDRLAPAALPVRYPINLDILNAWLSQRRLIDQLAKWVAKSQEVKSDG